MCRRKGKERALPSPPHTHAHPELLCFFLGVKPEEMGSEQVGSHYCAEAGEQEDTKVPVKAEMKAKEEKIARNSKQNPLKSLYRAVLFQFQSSSMVYSEIPPQMFLLS